MNEKTVKRLFDMEFDEVSLVDRPANQFASIAFSKAQGEEPSVSEDFEVEEVDIDDLEVGDVVVDEEGNEFEVVEEDDDTEVEKFSPSGLMGSTALSRLSAGFRAGKGAPRNVQPTGIDGRAGQTGLHLGRNRKRYATGAAATTAAGATYGGKKYMDNREEASKSLGDALLEELSKASGEDQRAALIAKAMDEVEIAKAAAAEAWDMAEKERDLRLTDEFISKAAEYNVPVAPQVLGPILKSMAETLSDEQLEVLDQLFESIGDVLYEEIGFTGENDNVSVLDQVNAHAAELVGKADIGGAQAIADIFEANPEAYEAYLTEGR